MSFAIRNLSVLSYAQGFTLWHYTEVATARATMDTSGYFNNASDVLAVGDMMIIRGSDIGLGLTVVSSNSGGVVDINDTNAIGSTDTD